MRKQVLDLVGVQLSHSHHVGFYHIDNCYRLYIAGVLTATVIQKGFDMPLDGRFEDVVDGLQRAYEPSLKVRWEQDGARVDRVYLQLSDGDPPLSVGLFGRWRQTYSLN